jgi:hypothetical protein
VFSAIVFLSFVLWSAEKEALVEWCTSLGGRESEEDRRCIRRVCSVGGRVWGVFGQGRRSADSCVGAGGSEASCRSVVGGSASLARGFGSVPSSCGGSLPAEGECGVLSTRGRVCAVPHPTCDSFTGVSTILGEGGGDEGVNSCEQLRTAAHFRVYACAFWHLDFWGRPK